MARPDVVTDVDVGEAMGQIVVRIRLHQRKRTLVRGHIASVLIRVVEWVAPWQLELIEDEE